MAVSAKKSQTIIQVFKEKLSTAHKKVHVIHSEEGWSVKKGLATRAYRSGRTFEEAVAIAKKIKSVDEVIIHHTNGKYEKIALM